MNAGDYFILVHKIEGFRTARLNWGTANAQPVTIGFWTAHHRAGVYTGTIRNNANNRSYAFTYTQTVADVGQYNVVTIPGDTAGTWAIDNSTGLWLTFAMAVGATNTAPSINTWLAGSYGAGPGQINAVAATSDIFRITGVVVLPGIEAPSAARSPLIMRPCGQELLTCKRYWQSFIFPTFLTISGYTASAQGVQWAVPLPVEMRASPTAAIVGSWGVTNSSQPTTVLPNTKSFGIKLTTAPGIFLCNNNNAGAGVTLDARL
jgi:hypothetical protein